VLQQLVEFLVGVFALLAGDVDLQVAFFAILLDTFFVVHIVHALMVLEDIVAEWAKLAQLVHVEDKLGLDSPDAVNSDHIHKLVTLFEPPMGSIAPRLTKDLAIVPGHQNDFVSCRGLRGRWKRRFHHRIGVDRGQIGGNFEQVLMSG